MGDADSVGYDEGDVEALLLPVEVADELPLDVADRVAAALFVAVRVDVLVLVGVVEPVGSALHDEVPDGLTLDDDVGDSDADEELLALGLGLPLPDGELDDDCDDDGDSVAVPLPETLPVLDAEGVIVDNAEPELDADALLEGLALLLALVLLLNDGLPEKLLLALGLGVPDAETVPEPDALADPLPDGVADDDAEAEPLALALVDGELEDVALDDADGDAEP